MLRGEEENVSEKHFFIGSNCCDNFHRAQGTFYCLLLQEFGGYFVVNGNEKLVRLLVTQRANYVRVLPGCKVKNNFLGLRLHSHSFFF